MTEERNIKPRLMDRASVHILLWCLFFLFVVTSVHSEEQYDCTLVGPVSRDQNSHYVLVRIDPAVESGLVDSAASFDAYLVHEGVAPSKDSRISEVHAWQVGRTHMLHLRGWPESASGTCDIVIEMQRKGGSSVFRLSGAVTVSAKGMDVVLLVDDSHSMRKTDPMRLRVTATRMFARIAALRNDVNTISLISFTYRARLLLPPTAPDDDQALEKALSGLKAEGRTDMDIAFSLAVKVLDPIPDTRKIAIVLSDGKDAPGRYADSHSLFKKRGWPVYTIGLSAEADVATLRRISTETGGKFYPAPEAEELAEIFRKIAISIHHEVVVTRWRTTRSAERPIPVDDTVRVLTLSLRDSEPGSFVSLLAPDMSRTRVSAEDRFVEVLMPQRGIWHGRTTTNVAATLEVTAQSDLELIPYPLVEVDGVLRVACVLVNQDGAVTGATVSAEVTRDGVVIGGILLSDEGRRRDTATEGIYCGSLVTSGGGSYGFVVTAKGLTDAGFAFERTASLGIRINEALVPVIVEEAPLPQEEPQLVVMSSQVPELVMVVPIEPDAPESPPPEKHESAGPAPEPETRIEDRQPVVEPDVALVSAPIMEERAGPSWIRLLLLCALILLVVVLFLRWLRRNRSTVPDMTKYVIVSILAHAAIFILAMNVLVETGVIELEEISPALAVRIRALEETLGIEITPAGRSIDLPENERSTDVQRASAHETSETKRSADMLNVSAEMLELQEKTTLDAPKIVASEQETAKKEAEKVQISESLEVKEKTARKAQEQEHEQLLHEDKPEAVSTKERRAALAKLATVGTARASEATGPLRTKERPKNEDMQVVLVDKESPLAESMEEELVAPDGTVNRKEIATEKEQATRLPPMAPGVREESKMSAVASTVESPSQLHPDRFEYGDVVKVVDDDAGRRKTEPVTAASVGHQTMVVIPKATQNGEALAQGAASAAEVSAKVAADSSDIRLYPKRDDAAGLGPSITTLRAVVASVRVSAVALDMDDKKKAVSVKTREVAMPVLTKVPVKDSVTRPSGSSSRQARTVSVHRTARSESGSVEHRAVSVAKIAENPEFQVDAIQLYDRSQGEADLPVDISMSRISDHGTSVAEIAEVFVPHTPKVATSSGSVVHGPSATRVPVQGRVPGTDARVSVRHSKMIGPGSSISIAMAPSDLSGDGDMQTLSAQDVRGKFIPGPEEITDGVQPAAHTKVARSPAAKGERRVDISGVAVDQSERRATVQQPSSAVKSADLMAVSSVDNVDMETDSLRSQLSFSAGSDARNALASIVIGLAKYSGGDWDCSATAMMFLSHEIEERTGMAISASDRVVDLSKSVPQSPFLYMTGHKDFTFTDKEIANLRRYLKSGGHLWIDDSTHFGDETFDVAVRREIARILPGLSLVKLDMTFAGFTTGYDLSKGYKGYRIPPGDKYRQDYIEGVYMDDRAVVVYTRNDYGDGLNIDPNTHPLRPSLTDLSPAEMQNGAVMMGVNLALYFMTSGIAGKERSIDEAGISLRDGLQDDLQVFDESAAKVVVPMGDEDAWTREEWGDACELGTGPGTLNVDFTLGEKRKIALTKENIDPIGVAGKTVLIMDADSKLRCGSRLALGLYVGDKYYESQPSYLKPGKNTAIFRLSAETFKTEATEWEYRAVLPLPLSISKVTVLIYSPAPGRVILGDIRAVEEK